MRADGGNRGDADDERDETERARQVADFRAAWQAALRFHNPTPEQRHLAALAYCVAAVLGRLTMEERDMLRVRPDWRVIYVAAYETKKAALGRGPWLHEREPLLRAAREMANALRSLNATAA